MQWVRQTSFAGGELSPLLWGRTDLELYHHGLRRCRNFYVTAQGAARSRPGLQYVASLGSSECRIIPFTVSKEDHRVIAFSNTGISIHGGAQTHVIATSDFSGETKWGFQYVQSGDVLLITTGKGPPIELRRLANDTWSYSTVSWSTVPKPPNDDDFITPVWVGRDPKEDPGRYALPYKRWRYLVTYVLRYPGGALRETEPYEVLESTVAHLAQTPAELLDRRSLEERLRIDPTFPSMIYACMDSTVFGTPPVGEVAEVRIYRGRSNIFGLVGVLEPPSTFVRGAIFDDDGRDPDTSRPPPQFRNPFVVKDPGASGKQRTGHPHALNFFEQRLVFGGSTVEPTKLWFSKVDDYLNFDLVKPTPLADYALEFELPARSREQIRALLPVFQRLLAFTDSGVWVVAGAEGTVQAGSLALVHRAAEHGVDGPTPLHIDDEVIWVKEGGSGIGQIRFSQERQGPVVGDRSTVAEHLLVREEGRGVRDWAVDDRRGVVWVVLRNSSALLSMTYRDGMNAWAEHHTSGRIMSVCVADDEVYFVVRRGSGNFTLEKFDPDHALTRLDSHVRRDVPAPSGSTFEVDGLDHLEGTDVRAVINGEFVQGPVRVQDGKATFQTPPLEPGDNIRATVGLFTPCDLETLDVPGEWNKMKVVRKVTFEVNQTRGLAAGETFSKLNRHIPSRSALQGSLPTTGRVEISVFSTWNKGGRVALRQEEPFPVTVLGITREGDISRGS